MASNFFNKASLVMVPDAPIDGKLPSVKPEDRSGDFTFSRGSNLAATRVNKDGLIEKGRENLLLQSNQFDTTWGLEATTLTSGQTGYDGSSDAWKVIPITDNSTHYVYKTTPYQTGVSTFSVYAKYSGYHAQLRVFNIGGGKAYANFDLQNGTKGTSGGTDIIDSTITSVGNGWYRITLSLNYTIAPYSSGVIPIESPTDGEIPSYAGDGTSGVLIQDFQHEVGLVATGYIETTTAAVQKGILENLPRIDYSGGASCPSLLLEPQRTNRILFSEWLGAWDSFSTFLTYKDGISPSGYKDATKLYIPADNANVYIRTQFSNVANQTHIGSIFLKKVDGDEVRLRLSGGAPNIEASAIFNLSNGTYRDAVGSVTPSIENYGNGWYRCSVGDLGGATVATPSLRIDALGTGYAPTVYVWGAQVEVGSYPTSYIPAYGSSVTRSNEFLDAVSYNTTLPTSAFTLFFDFGKTQAGIGSGYIYRMDIDGTNTEFDLYQNPFSGGGLNVYLNGQGGYVFGTGGNDAWNADASKVAISYDGDKLSYFINGSLYNSITGISFIDAGTKPNFRVSNSSPQFDLKQYLSFPTALTNDECIALTTI